MKTATLFSIVLLALTMAGCSDPEAEKQEANRAVMQKFLNQNPSGRLSSMEEAKNLDPNTGEPRVPKEKNGQN